MSGRDPLARHQPVAPTFDWQPAERPPTLGELFSAGMEAAAPDRTIGERDVVAAAYQPVLEVLNEGRVRHWWKPDQHADQAFTNPGLWHPTAGGERERDTARIWAEIDRRRATEPGFLPKVPKTRREFEAQYAKTARDKVEGAYGVLERGEGAIGWGAGFAGQVVKSFDDPLVIGTLLAGGGGKTIAQVAAREALINGTLATTMQPFVAANRDRLGMDYTAENFLTNVTIATVAGAAFGGTIKGGQELAPRLGDALGRGYDAAIERAYAAMPESVQARWASAMEIPDGELPGLARTIIGAERMTPDERAAAAVIEDAELIDRGMPWSWSPENAEAHAEAVAAGMRSLLEEVPLATPRPPSPLAGTALASGTVPAPRMAGEPAGDIAGYMARNRRVESSGNDAARAATSSAYGRYQFTERTWLTYYARRFGDTGESRAAILAKRADGELQDVLMRDLTEDSARTLSRNGYAATHGNLYLMHFAGEAGGLALLRAGSDTPVERVLSAGAINANRSVLAGKTAGQVIAWAHRKMGGRGAPEAGPVVAAAGEDVVAATRVAAAAIDAEPVPGGVPRETSAVDEALAQPSPPPDAIDAPIDVEDMLAPAPDASSQAARAPDAAEPRDLVAEVLAHAADGRASLSVRTIERKLKVTGDEAREALRQAARASGGTLTVSPSGRVLRTPAGEGPVDALKFLARKGGLRNDEGHDLRNTFLPHAVSGGGWMFRRDGMSIDEAGEALWDAGYFGPPSVVERPDTAEVLAFLDEASRSPAYSHNDMGEVLAREADAERADMMASIDRDIEAELFALGELELDAAGLRRAAELVAHDGYSPRDAALFVINEEAVDAQRAMAIESDDIDYDIDWRYEDGDGRTADSDIAAGDGRSPGDAGDAGEGRAGAPQYLEAEEDLRWRDTADAVDDGALAPWDDPHGTWAREQADSLEHDLRMGEPSPVDLAGEGERTLNDVLREAEEEQAAIDAARRCLKPGGAD